MVQSGKRSVYFKSAFTALEYLEEDAQELYQYSISAIRGSLAAGVAQINSSESLHGPVPHTTTPGESDTKENCPAA